MLAGRLRKAEKTIGDCHFKISCQLRQAQEDYKILGTASNRHNPNLSLGVISMVGHSKIIHQKNPSESRSQGELVTSLEGLWL